MLLIKHNECSHLVNYNKELCSDYYLFLTSFFCPYLSIEKLTSFFKVQEIEAKDLNIGKISQ